MKTILRLITLFVGLPTLLVANGIRVDIDNYQVGRTDMYTQHWYNWVFTDGTSDSFTAKGIKATVRNVNGTGIKSGWFKGLLYYGTTLTMDGVIVDGSPTGGSMELVLSGLSAGKHSIVTWHNFYDAVTGSTMKVAVNGTTVKTGVKVPSRVQNSDLAARVYLEFTATAGQSVVIRFTAEGNGTFDNVVLNGFEIDGSDPAKKISNPLPSEWDTHWEQSKGLAWTKASGATSHNLYLGTDSLTVLNATTSSPSYKGTQTTTTYALSGLNTFQAAYWWRVDENIGGTIVKGDVIPFRIARLAFPTAEGYGRFARGGRGGRVVFVTNLNDSGAGSLRDAIEVQKGARTIIFKVGGTILLNSRLSLPPDGGDVYVAGQTAPGDGICVARYAFGVLAGKDVIIRHIRTRVGDYAGVAMDGMGLASSDHCIIDHCSISWTTDEGTSSRSAHNISFQHNIVSECLNNSVHYLDGTGNNDTSATQPHSFAASISGNKGSYHHNLLCHCTGRNWSLAGGLEQDAKHYGGHLDITNNLIYNWVSRTTDGGVKEVNFVNNYYKGGPSTTMYDHILEIDGDQLGLGDMQMAYMAGNKMTNYSGTVLLSPTGDQWAYGKSDFSTVTQVKSTTPFFPSYVTTETADQAYTSILGNVGATYPKLDAIDTRIIKETKNNTYTYVGSIGKLKGIIDSQKDAGGYPTLKGGTAPTDTDNDGMPDAWETAHGLSITAADNNGDRDGDGYTNLEEYLACLVGELTTCNVVVNNDCNGVKDGTATKDKCDRCVGGTTGKTVCTAVGEAETDACSFDGVAETKNSGYKGSSYLNIDNAVGTAITFNVSATAAGTYTISFRYANGSTTDRTAQISVNGTVLANTISFPVTGTFTDWSTVDVSLALAQGTNEIRLISATADGMGNIDQIGYVSTGIGKGSCLITGIDDSNTNQHVSIYPNPSKSNFHVNVSQTVNMQVIDAEGKLCEEHKNVSSTEFGENLKPGIYFLKVENKVYKLVKE